MRLDIGETAIEKFFRAVDRQLLDLIDEFATAVIAPARIAFGVFVGQHRALRFEHGARHDVLGCDELDLILLTPELAADRGRDIGIGLGQRRGEKPVGRRRGLRSRHACAFASENLATRRA